MIATMVLNVVDCADCGMPFGMPNYFEDRRRDDHKTFYCPHGHSNVYNGLNKAQRLKRELKSTQDRLASTEYRFTREKNSARALKGQATKLRKRISNGVCPCCSRTFVNLHRHMTGQHPEFAVDLPA